MSPILRKPMRMKDSSQLSFLFPHSAISFMKPALQRKLILLCLLFITVEAIAQKTIGRLHLKNGELIVRENNSDAGMKQELAKGRTGANTYAILVFESKPTAQQLQRLKIAGIDVLGYLPDNAIQVRFRYTPATTVLTGSGVKSIIQLPAAYKYSKELSSKLSDPFTNGALLNVSIYVLPGVSVKDVLPELKSKGFSLTSNQYINQGLLIGTTYQNNISKLGELPYVFYVNLAAFEPQPLMQRERAAFGLTGLTSTQGSGRNLSGSGVTVGVGDNADPTSHIDNIVNVVNRNPSFLNTVHGTHVTGVVSGDGIIEERLTGTAPNSFVVTDFFDYIISKTPVYVSDYGMTLTNNSYFIGYNGCAGNGDYNELSVYADQQLYNNPFLQHIFAAGNDGALTCTPFPSSFGTVKSGYQTAKNVLSVGNCDIFITGAVSASSSRGPVKDGRIKPEIMASGNSVGGPGLNNAYTNNIGTSAAAPFVSGVWALLTERYKQLNSNNNPKSGLLKAILCNTATDKGNAGPDFENGFGWINPQQAVAVLEQGQYYSGSLSFPGNQSQTITVPSGTKRLKVMLYWHDREGSPLAVTELVNDLDLTVTDGVTPYEPWKLNPAPGSVTAAAVRGADHLNNIEQVTIDNPGSSVTIDVTAFNIPVGAQEYFVVYDFVADDLKVLHPYGGEHFSTFSTSSRQEMISWEANDNSTNTFTLEYSTDNGGSWNTIHNSVAASEFRYLWNVPDAVSTQAKIRVTRNGGGASAVSTGNFTIMGLPALTLSNPCEGYADLNWTAVTGASDYEVFKVVNGVLTPIITTTGTTYRAGGLSKSSTYWFTVRARITDSLGRRAIAKSITPSVATPCSGVYFDNDLKLDTMLTPNSGRKFTSTELSNAQSITVRIKNLDDAATSGTYTVSYQVNSGTIVNENVSTTINAGGTLDYTFSTTADLSAMGNYTIRVFVKNPGDARTENDEQTYTVRHVNNDPVTLPFTETFESAPVSEYRNSFFALNNLDRFDYTTSSINGRLRTQINSGMAINGSKSITLDAAQFKGPLNNNKLTATINLSNEASTPDLRFDFKFRNHGQLKSPATGVWMRGRDDQPWVLVYNLTDNQGELGEISQAWVNINEVMTSAGQPISSSFQVRFDQEGITSANNGDYIPENADIDDGFSFDDIRIVQASNDLTVTDILSPASLYCNAGITAVTIRVKNLTGNTYNNVPVLYRLDNGTPVSETIPVINPNSSVDYTFSTQADLSAYKKFTLDAWVQLPSDDYPVNDSITNTFIYNSPVVNSYPYLQRFESNDGNYFTTGSYSSWKWGGTDANTRTYLDRSANGTKSWFTSLAGAYKTNEYSYLYSPCFDLSSLTNPVLSFAHISNQEDGYDYHSVEYTINNGASWQKLGVQNGGTNWFDYVSGIWLASKSRWHVSSVEIPTTASSVRFRFLFSSDELVTKEGIGIDDIYIFEKNTIYTGANTTVTETVNGNDWVDFRSGGNLVASIHPLGQNLGSTDASVYINTGAVRYINNQYYLDRNIVIRPTVAPTDSVLVRFYFTETEYAALVGANNCTTCGKPRDAFMVGITKFNGTALNENGTLADNAGVYSFINPANVDVLPYNNGYYAEFKVRSFSEFWINSGGIDLNQPLPVTILSFGGNKRAPHIDLQWQTSNETNSSYFEIERKLDNQPLFETIGRIAAAGNSTQTKNYQFTDQQALLKGNKLLYRLKMVDEDGRYTYSNTLSFNTNANDLFIQNTYRAGNQLIVVAGNKQGVKEMTVRIMNSAGQVLLQQKLAYGDAKLNISSLPAGTYLVEIKDANGGASYIQKLVTL